VIGRFREFEGHHLHVVDPGWVPGEHEGNHLRKRVALLGSGPLVEIDGPVYFAVVLVDQVADHHGLEDVHLDGAEMAALDIGEVRHRNHHEWDGRWSGMGTRTKYMRTR